MINYLKGKINFGNDQYSIKLEFSWKDVLKNDFFSSFNVNFELYSTMFNLAVCFNLLGKTVDKKSEDENKIREAIKYFQYAAFLFDKIKQEITGIIPAKEIQPDMSSNYLTYVNF